MYNHAIPDRDELPSTAKLVRSTILAAIVAAVLLVTVVMPAEYALDPTGVGRMLGLSEMGEIKRQLAEEAAADETYEKSINSVGSSMPNQASAASKAEPAEPERGADPVAQARSIEPAMPEWKDEIRVVLTPGQGTEYKLTMQEGAVAQFVWESEGGPINYDTHGNGSGQRISYEKGRGVPKDEGELKAAFTGNHGWFFRNRNKRDITLILKTKGDYGQLKKVI